MSVRAGERLRQIGQDQATHGAAFHNVLMIDLLIANANRSGRNWSANDIRDQVPVVRQGLVGARVDAARKRGEMEAVGWTKSTLASTRGKPVTVWRGKRPETGSSSLPLLGWCALMLTLGLIVGYLTVSPFLTLELAR